MSSQDIARNHPRGQSKRLLIDGVSKKFGDMQAVENISLDVQPGELVALLGPSGCGKTTTLRLVAGFEYPDAGTISIDEKEISHLPPNKRGLGMVFQNYSLFPHMTVAQNVGYGLEMAGVSKAEREQSVQRMLALIRMPAYGDRRVSQLSGGQQQRVALARAIVTHPAVLLLDEPLGALDKSLREEMQFEIRRLQRTLGITSVMVTHDQEEAMTMSDRIVVMSGGQVLQMGAPTEVYDHPRTRFVAEFLGTANILHGDVQHVQGGDVDIALACHNDATPRPVIRLLAQDVSDVDVGQRVDLAVRPEKIMLDAPAENHVRLTGTIREHVFRGSQHTYLIDVPAFERPMYVYAQATSRGLPIRSPGQTVTLSFSLADVVLLHAESIQAPAAPMQKAA